MADSCTFSILIADKFDNDGIEALRELGHQVHVDTELDPDSMGAAIAATGAQVLAVRSTKVPAHVIESASELKLIIRGGAGYDNIDCEAAGKAGVAVCNTPGMNAVAVAESVFGHLINLDRRINEQTNSLKGGRWNKKEYAKARGLKGRRMLVVGMGSIGTEVIKRAQAFGMQVSAQSRSLREDTARALGIELITYTREALSEALGNVDVVSVHVALTPDTHELCGPGFFAAMKPGAYFINTSRGEIVDEGELANAMETKGIRAGLDVFQNQPSSKDTEWRPSIADMPGISLTHHIGASTDQAQIAVVEEVVRIVDSYARTNKPLHVVNAQYLADLAAAD
jgi:D-3-phosphoglycerate dehydrogenase